MHPKKILNFIKRANVVSELSHDLETQVGSILVDSKNFDQLASGYNGFIRGARDEELPKTRSAKYKYMIHAEANLIYNAARNGIKTDGNIVVQTLSPCFECARMLYQSGVKEVYFKELYHIYTPEVMRELHYNHLEKSYIVELEDITLQLTYNAEYYKMYIMPTQLKLNIITNVNQNCNNIDPMFLVPTQNGMSSPSSKVKKTMEELAIEWDEFFFDLKDESEDEDE